MDRANNEMVAVETAIKEANEDQLRELNDLQLAFVGGGSGDPILH
jgi:hypothetical protein